MDFEAHECIKTSIKVYIEAYNNLVMNTSVSEIFNM